MPSHPPCPHPYPHPRRLAGGVPVPVPLKFVPYPDSPSSYSGSWELDLPALQSAITPKTAAVVLNSPHNPTGKVFTGEEMTSIADCIRPHDKIKVLSDEVYKFIIHSPPKETSFETTVPGHVHFASLPGMYDRTLTISSAGKTFSATGWQVGWMVGPESLVGAVQQMLPYVQFCANSVCQEALAGALRKAEEVRPRRQRKRRAGNLQFLITLTDATHFFPLSPPPPPPALHGT